jgi:kynurenine formamidase
MMVALIRSGTLMRRFIDLSHTLHDGLVTYPGLPAPRIGEHLDRTSSRAHYAGGTEFMIGKIELVANTGTYLDAPFHRFEQGRDLAELPLETLADLPGVVVRASRGVRAIGRELFADCGALAGRAVLIDTGWSRHFGTSTYGSGHPFLTRAAAEFLVEQRVVLVGIDSLNIDDTEDGLRPAHTLLLGRDIRIVEHLTNLAALPDAGFRFFAVPVKIRGLGSFPVRAFARLE